MTQQAGQMVPAGSALAVSRYWVPANRRAYPRRIAHDFFKRYGFRPGVAAIWRIRPPSSPGWLVLLRDDPTQPDLLPGTPNVGAPPTTAPATITINTIPASAAGPIAVSGTVSPPGTPLQGAFNNNNGATIGGFSAMTVTGGTWSGVVNCAISANMRVRVRQTAQPSVYVDSNNFVTTVFGAG